MLLVVGLFFVVTSSVFKIMVIFISALLCLIEEASLGWAALPWLGPSLF